jgi:hypothetical protein
LRENNDILFTLGQFDIYIRLVTMKIKWLISLAENDTLRNITRGEQYHRDLCFPLNCYTYYIEIRKDHTIWIKKIEKYRVKYTHVSTIAAI